jgi:tetratricopeptide (TPR) repeat protein
MSVAQAQTPDAKEADPFDLSKILASIEELGVPTVTTVSQIENNAKTLFEQEKWLEAAEAFGQAARHENWLANLISAGLEPYYGSSYDDKKTYDYSKLKSLIPLEKMSNEYKSRRNQSMILQAECYEQLGNKTKAVALYVKALDLMNVDEQIWWDKARVHLYSIIEVNQ